MKTPTEIVIKKTGTSEGKYSTRAAAKEYARAYLKTGTYRFVPCKASEVPSGF